MKFYYEGFTARGEPKKGTIEAASEQEAAGKLRNQMNIFANRLSPEDFNPTLEHVVKDSPEVAPYVPGEGMRLHEEPVEAPKPDEPPKVRQAQTMVIPKEDMEKLAGKLSTPGECSLSRDLSKIAAVVRQVEAWRKMSGELKTGDKLPSGLPDVGPETWNVYEGYRGKIVSELFYKAMEKASGLRGP